MTNPLIKTRQATTQMDPVQFVSFGIRDSKGREIGAAIETGVRTFVAIDPAATSWNRTAPGTYFYGCFQATRDGRIYGAVQSDQYFGTDKEREAAIAKYLKSAKARAAKKGGAK